MPPSAAEWAGRVEEMRAALNEATQQRDDAYARNDELRDRNHNLRIALQNMTEDRDELKVEHDAIIKDFAIEGDNGVRSIIERYNAALCSMKPRETIKRKDAYHDDGFCSETCRGCYGC